MKRGAALFALLVGACGAPAGPTTPKAQASTAKAASAQPRVAASTKTPETKPPVADADATVAAALEVVSRVRGLPAKTKVPGARLDRKALFAEVQRLLKDESPTEAIAGNTELLFALDAVTADFDLQSTLLKLYASELAGFYDPKLRRMVLATDLGEAAERMTLYHELVHALQDQHFDLSHVFDWKPEAADVEAALHALAEGDATVAMTDIFAAASGTTALELPAGAFQLDAALVQASPTLRDVPGVIARSMIAPYSDGMSFVRYLRQRGGWAAVDGAFQRPPASTEQLLHPAKYVTGEPVVALPALETPVGYSDAAFRDVMGEQGLRILFEDWMPASAAAEAASDWGGDKLAVFSSGGDRVVRLHLVFDTDAAAKRALLAFARGAARPELGASYDPLRSFADRRQALAAVRRDEVCQSRTQRGAFAAARHGRHVGVSLGPYHRGAKSVQGSSDCATALGAARSIAKAR